jgi:hypothetical protein
VLFVGGVEILRVLAVFSDQVVEKCFGTCHSDRREESAFDPRTENKADFSGRFKTSALGMTPEGRFSATCKELAAVGFKVANQVAQFHAAA